MVLPLGHNRNYPQIIGLKDKSNGIPSILSTNPVNKKLDSTMIPLFLCDEILHCTNAAADS